MTIQLIILLASMVVILQACTSGTESREVLNPVRQDTTDSSSDTENVESRAAYADVNGIRMYYEIIGTGRPLVLIHGGGSTIQTTFGRIIPNLSKDRQLVAVELQAHGHTSDRSSKLSFEQDADDVAALLKHLNIDSVDVLGFSNGGTTAVQIAIRHPHLARRVIAASPLLKRNGTVDAFWQFMKAASLKDMPLPYKEAFLQITKDSAALQRMHDKCAQRMLNFMDIPDSKLAAIKTPMLLINGDADVATSEHIVAMAKLIPGCKLAILPGGHGEYIGEITSPAPKTPEQLPALAIIRDFINND